MGMDLYIFNMQDYSAGKLYFKNYIRMSYAFYFNNKIYERNILIGKYRKYNVLLEKLFLT